MGSGNSKPAEGISQHVFSSDTPVRFSNELVDSLQKNTQTDSTRSKTQELQYQTRLTAELEKLRDQETTHLSNLTDSVSAEIDAPSEPSLTEKLGDAVSSSATLAEKQRKKDMSRDSVTKEIEALKKKLEARKKIDQVDPSVTKAKEEVVTCLRLHDRRPLNCWKEVETFRKEVGRLEQQFVEKTIR
jgi:altered-inheritance-of-mitochondria protein 13